MNRTKISARIDADSPLFYEENMSEAIREALERYYRDIKQQEERKDKDERTHNKRV